MSHLYIGIEVLTMTAAMRDTLVEALKKIGRQDGPYPNLINHWRIRPDGMAAIFEAEFDAGEVTPNRMTNRLEGLYNLGPGTVSQTVTQTAYGPLVTFKTGSTNRLRLIAFGGVDVSWGESSVAVQKYLSDSKSTWETETA